MLRLLTSDVSHVQVVGVKRVLRVSEHQYKGFKRYYVLNSVGCQ